MTNAIKEHVGSPMKRGRYTKGDEYRLDIVAAIKQTASPQPNTRAPRSLGCASRSTKLRTQVLRLSSNTPITVRMVPLKNSKIWNMTSPRPSRNIGAETGSRSTVTTTTTAPRIWGANTTMNNAPVKSLVTVGRINCGRGDSGGILGAPLGSQYKHRDPFP